MTITDYLNKCIADEKGVKGFTIGRGKKVYWYITPMPRSGTYRCLPIDEPGLLGWPRFVKWDQEIQVVRDD